MKDKDHLIDISKMNELHKHWWRPPPLYKQQGLINDCKFGILLNIKQILMFMFHFYLNKALILPIADYYAKNRKLHRALDDSKLL